MTEGSRRMTERSRRVMHDSALREGTAKADGQPARFNNLQVDNLSLF